MKLSLAGLLAVGLAGAPGQAGSVRDAEGVTVRVGTEWLVVAADEMAMRDTASGWSVARSGGLRPSQRSLVQAVAGHPVLYVEGEAPDDRTRRIVTGCLSVRLRDKAAADGAAAGVAADFGLYDEGVAEGAAPWRVFRAEPPGRAVEVIDQLRSDARVVEADVVVARQASARGLPNDPLIAEQWHLKNLVPSADGGLPVDLGVEGVWGDFEDASGGVRGRGIRLGIMDDGIDDRHAEFVGGRLDTAADWNWNDGLSSNGAAQRPVDTHGTAVAGLAAASAHNAFGVAGVAPDATLISLRLTAGAHDDIQEAQAIAYLATPRSGANPAGMIHVKNASWGPGDGNFRLAGPGPLARQALVNAVRDGRGGRGTVFVWAAGNGGALGEDANADGYANSPQVIAVGAMDSNGRVAGFSEGGACVAVVAPSGSEQGRPLVTTDRPGDLGFNPPATGSDVEDPAFTRGFGGTSAAAPLVAGVCALMLEVNPSLGWRDVKEILMRTARRVNPTSPAWMTNGAGLRFHPLQGAGLVDAAVATRLASRWTPLGPQIAMTATAAQASPIPDDAPAGVIREFKIQARRRVEHAVLRLTANHRFRGDLKVTLTSPSGTVSVLAPSYFVVSGRNQANYEQWAFSSVQFWGENAQGTWSLRVADVVKDIEGQLVSAELSLLTSEFPPPPVFTSAASGAARVGLAFEHVAVVSNGPATFVIEGALPPGLVFDGATGALRGVPEQTGIYAFTIQAVAASGSVSQVFKLQVTGGFDAWMAASSVPGPATGPTDDPDGDGCVNLLEYANGGNPARPEAAPDSTTVSAADGKPSATFTRQIGRTDLLWTIQHSIDGQSWTDIAESRSGEPAVSLDPNRFAVIELADEGRPSTVTIVDLAQPAPAQAWFRARVMLSP